MGLFHQFVRHQFPNASKNLCRGRLRCFSRQKNIENEQFRLNSGMTAKNWYKAFNDIILQAMNTPYKHLGGDLQYMIMEWFNASGQELAVAWFNKYWMCNCNDGGRWMICHFGHGGPFNNNGTESINAGIRKDLLEISAAGQKSPVHSRELLARACGYIRSKSE